MVKIKPIFISILIVQADKFLKVVHEVKYTKFKNTTVIAFYLLLDVCSFIQYRRLNSLKSC